jgi:hypothetical protein
MKSILLLALTICLYFNLSAAPGDTTWIQAHTVKQLGASPANFDTMINFPDGSTKYRKVIMIFTLGKYVCPGSPMYCSDWDYTVQTYAMNKLGDTVELGRLITPYANSTRMPASWTQPYYFDVTDFATVLKDSNKIRINFSGYSGGFTGDIKFAMIEGTPERNVLGVTKMWAGSYAYGNASSPIDAKVSAKTITAPTGTQSAIYRFNVTGHGSDPNYCSEFCSKYYQLLKDGTLVAQKDIWRDNCGFNNFYPQNGTWIYDRANWCPGDLVHTNFHTIPSVTSGSTFNLSMAFEPYTSTGAASYTLFGNVVFYGSINKSMDASLEDIIAPTNNENHYRENARIGFTTVKIRNSGSTTINNIQFEYGVTGQPSTIATWTGSLSSLTDTIIDLPFAESLLKATGTNLAYEVKILKVNSLVDDDATNNKISSVFTPVLPMASNAVVIFRTNKSLTGTGYSETEWTITDETSGAVVKSRINNTPETTYEDTLNLPTGVYKFTVSDAGCDGLSWWANLSGGSGSIQIKPTLFTSYTLRGNFGGDFGCGFKQYFRVGNPTDIRYVNAESAANLSVFPNPASDKVTITIDGIPVTSANIVIRDNFGRVLFSQTIKENQLEFDAKQFANGLYFVTVYSADNSFPRMQSKFILKK